jgi:hypothetical protein
MVSVIQLFNGEEQRIVGRARTFDGTVKHLKSAMGAGEGWGVKLRGTIQDLADVGAYQRPYGWRFVFRAGNPRARKIVTVFCEVI